MNFVPLLQQLSATAPVSGEALAAALNISRAAVWKQIEQLRALGLEIAAGMYIYYVKDDITGEEKMGKFGVIK